MTSPGTAPGTDPGVEPPLTAAQLRLPAPVARYVRSHPFSVGLSVVLVATGLVFGTFWGGFPVELSAGPATTGGMALWWTPITALLVPDSLVEIVIVIPVLLTVGAYAERLLGTARAIVVFLVGGALGVLLGVGFELLGASWGTVWGIASETDFVLDPPIGIFAVVMAASALAPALFRRRIRVIGLAALAMFALYAGDSDSVYRLLAALVGLVAGLAFARGAATGAWHRSSYRETRTLVAAIVAVTGLGPLIVLVSGGERGPLALVVSGFAQVDPDEVLGRCANVQSAACDVDLAVAMTTGVGPFLLSLMPLALSLLAAWGLRTGRRSAWLLGIAVSAATAVLTSIALGTTELLDASTVHELDADFVVSAVLATLLPIGVIVLLLVTWRRFQVRAPRAAVRRFLVVVVGALVVLGGGYVVLGLVGVETFVETPTVGDLLADVVRIFVPAGLVAGIPAAALPSDGFALFAFQWIGVVFWLVFVGGMLMLYRATAPRRNAAAEARFRELLKTKGGGTLGFMGTWPGNDYWFAPAGDGAVAFRVISGVALTMSDPVCAPGDASAVIRQFVDFCDRRGWTAVFYSFHEQYVPVFDELGWQYASVGEETIVALPGLELAGKPWQKVRQAYNRGLREGMSTVWSTWDDLPAAVSAQIDAISEEWVSEKELPEMGFTLGGMEELKDPDVYLYLAIDGDQKVQAVTSWLPSWTDGRVTGWTIDFMRRGSDSMPGIMEFVIASAALHMKDLGAEVLSLSGAPLATKPAAPGEAESDPTVMTRLLAWLGGVLEPAYGFTSLFTFKKKFNPRYETIYMAYADPVELPTIGLAIGRAYLPEVSPRESVALVKTLTGGGDH